MYTAVFCILDEPFNSVVHKLTRSRGHSRIVCAPVTGLLQRLSSMAQFATVAGMSE